MKYMNLVLFVLIPFAVKSQNFQKKNSNKEAIHSTINATGGDISSEEGNVSYSIGQVFYSAYEGSSDYSVTEGVQQPLVISIEPLATEKEEELKLIAYPNPVTDYFTIEASDYNDRSLSYHLTDLNGRMIKGEKINKSGTQVNISTLPAGIYLLVVSDNGTRIKTTKIIKN
ncbi:MAG: T9SS type A sorting domain-containing protein [Christiangramia sp.]